MWDTLGSQTALSGTDSSVLSLSVSNTTVYSGLQHPQDIIRVTDAIHHSEEQKLESMLCVQEHLLMSGISETMENELYPLIYAEMYRPDTPHLILFYNTGCLCLCLHWFQIIVMHTVWVAVWNVKCNGSSAQWFCVVVGSFVFGCGVRGMRKDRSVISFTHHLHFNRGLINFINSNKNYISADSRSAI